MSFETAIPPYGASDPTASFLNASCFDFLLIELVPMAHRIASELDASATAAAAAAANSTTAASSATTGAAAAADGAGPHHTDGTAPSSAAGGASAVAGSAATRSVPEDEERDAAFYRLEMLGYRVGQGLVER
ncbi:MAG: hypothetical protein OK454_06135 [Thaumarchaeota archaeon]|nr:hypothetical protein [Nitrososphaerota archaeon]